MRRKTMQRVAQATSHRYPSQTIRRPHTSVPAGALQHEALALECARRALVAGVDFAFQAAQVQGVSEVIDEAGQCFVHVAPALHGTGQAVADFAAAGHIVDVEQLHHADEFAIVTAYMPSFSWSPLA